MQEITIEELAYFIKEAKKANQPQPIFFLGAGASVTGNIPLARDIEKKILEDFAENPKLKKLEDTEKEYSKLMGCLLPAQRTALMKGYIDEAKINVTHIYLAQLLKEGYVDYVLTVNFDNLMLRALALYNIFPPTYDLSILKDLTTTTFNKASVTYLHGKYNGPWILNTESEMARVKENTQRIFDSIKNQRPWIFIGYSGSDPIFEHVKRLGRFDNGLYWVGYKENSPDPAVRDFLKDPNNNSSHVKGYDADAFMLKLNEELGLPQPDILNKPFSLLKGMLDGIIDINDEEHFKGVKERLTIAKNSVERAIQIFDGQRLLDANTADEKIELERLKKQMIDLLIAEAYDEELISSMEDKLLDSNDPTAMDLVSQYYYYWGNKLGDKAEIEPQDTPNHKYSLVFEKYDKATRINPELKEAWLNWAIRLGNFAQSKSDSEAESYYKDAFSKYRIAISLDPNYVKAFAYWGLDLGEFAEQKEGNEATTLYSEAYSKFEKALELNPSFQDTYVNYGLILESQAESKSGNASIPLLKKAIKLYKKAIDISIDSDIHYNWGNALCKLGLYSTEELSEKYFQEATDQFEKSYSLDSSCYECLNNWAIALSIIALKKEKILAYPMIEKAIGLFKLAIEKSNGNPAVYSAFGSRLLSIQDYQKNQGDEIFNKTLRLAKNTLEYAANSGEPIYALSCCHAQMNKKEEAFRLLKQALDNNETTKKLVLADEYWRAYREDPEFKALVS